jgi:hypothetical protein
MQLIERVEDGSDVMLNHRPASVEKFSGEAISCIRFTTLQISSMSTVRQGQAARRMAQ